MARKIESAERSYAAARPTVDELLAARTRANRVNVDFLKVDLKTALTFSEVALKTDDPVKRRRNCNAARKAYDTILRLMPKVALTEAEADLLTDNLARLKSELQSLGETF